MNRSVVNTVAAGIGLLITASLLGPAVGVAQSPKDATSPGAGTSPASVIAWNEIAQNASVVVAKQPPPESMVYLGLVQAAVYDAVDAITGGYEPYGRGASPHPGADIDVAVAAAADAMLEHYFPAQQADLAARYAAFLLAVAPLVRIEGDPGIANGLEAGREAALNIIAARAGDGLEADTGFKMPAAAAGIWQLPADQKPQTPWLAKLKPFLLTSADQFLPSAPPALSSAAYAAEFNETKSLGSVNSTTRTPEQTLIAQFFTAPVGIQYNEAFKQIVADHAHDALQAARLYAMGNMVGADALTACMNAKYTYDFWRPAYAIPGADADGNDATVADASWKPLLATPPHPEYPSNHACFEAAIGQVLASVLGTDKIDLTLTSSVTADTMPSRHYATVADLVNEVMNARIWGGLHFRGSDEAGRDLGTKVANWAISREFLPDVSIPLLP